MKTVNLPKTPLQRVVGFDVAEEIYDQLPLIPQLILDLKIEGWNDTDISRALGMPRVTLIDTFRRSRYALAKLKMVLEVRIHYRETHTSVMDNGGPFEGLSSNQSQFNNGKLPFHNDE